jgi:glycine cleavage system H lipoate-binding protein
VVTILVLATFAVFVCADYYLHHRRPQPVLAKEIPMAARDIPAPLQLVGGYDLPANFAYHPGHAWALRESPKLVRVGLDDFAARLLGDIEQVELPARGRWLRQGEKGWYLIRRGHRFEMLSPIEGEVVEVNPRVVEDPSLLQKDPYGVGWLVAVNAPAANGNMKNLMRGRLAQHWMEESGQALRQHIDPHTGMHLQDGGRVIPDVLSSVPEDHWDAVVHDLLLTD